MNEAPVAGQLVGVRQRQYFVEEVVPKGPGELLNLDRELNRQRAEEERLSGVATEDRMKSPKRGKRTSRKQAGDQPEWFS
jgi:hypothetical protein